MNRFSVHIYIQERNKPPFTPSQNLEILKCRNSHSTLYNSNIWLLSKSTVMVKYIMNKHPETNVVLHVWYRTVMTWWTAVACLLPTEVIGLYIVLLNPLKRWFAQIYLYQNWASLHRLTHTHTDANTKILTIYCYTLCLLYCSVQHTFLFTYIL